MACDEVLRCRFDEGGVVDAATIERMRTTRMEAATGRQFGGTGNVAREDRPLALDRKSVV